MRCRLALAARRACGHAHGACRFRCLVRPDDGAPCGLSPPVGPPPTSLPVGAVREARIAGDNMRSRAAPAAPADAATSATPKLSDVCTGTRAGTRVIIARPVPKRKITSCVHTVPAYKCARRQHDDLPRRQGGEPAVRSVACVGGHGPARCQSVLSSVPHFPIFHTTIDLLTGIWLDLAWAWAMWPSIAECAGAVGVAGFQRRLHVAGTAESLPHRRAGADLGRAQGTTFLAAATGCRRSGDRGFTWDRSASFLEGLLRSCVRAVW